VLDDAMDRSGGRNFRIAGRRIVALEGAAPKRAGPTIRKLPAGGGCQDWRKWLELLKEIAPRVTRAAVLRDPAIPEGVGQFAVIQSVAPSFAVELRSVDVRNVGEIERAITTFAHESNGLATSAG
jgi:hypothetical protein